MGLSRKNNSNEVFTSSNDMKGSHGNASSSFHPASIEDSRWLERMVQAFISCVTTGNVKVSYSHCYICVTTFVVERDWEVSMFLFLISSLSGTLLSVTVCLTGPVECLSCIEQPISKWDIKTARHGLVWYLCWDGWDAICLHMYFPDFLLTKYRYMPMLQFFAFNKSISLKAQRSATLIHVKYTQETFH